MSCQLSRIQNQHYRESEKEDLTLIDREELKSRVLFIQKYLAQQTENPRDLQNPKQHRHSLDDIFNTQSVSYTHLTLPTILLVQISVVAVSLKKKKQKKTQCRAQQQKKQHKQYEDKSG
eukprot:TRINITY_DN32246_c0_g1_i1.p5 TRINITY_DN32246_c0_g1~~TRINITY_DN32246_c0_g1_i1.p5  ORF type:complete len:119 (-),score=18.79 TRINITY_DN32246_c0_g1_i1:43-399(-)